MALLVDSTRDAFSLIESRQRWRWLLLVALALVQAGVEAVGAALVFVLVSLVSSAGTAVSLPVIGDLSEAFPGTSPSALQQAAALSIGIFFVLRGVLLVGQQYVQGRIAQSAGAAVATRLARGYLSMPYLFHTQRNSSELVRNATDSAERVTGQVFLPLVSIMAQSILIVGLTVVLLVTSPLATAFAIVGLGAALWLVQHFVQPRLKEVGDRLQMARSGSLLSIQQALGGYREIRLLGREEHFSSLFATQRSQLARSESLRMTLFAVPRSVIEAALVISIVVIFMVTLLTGDGVDTVVATLAVFAYVGLRLQPSLQILVSGYNELRVGTAVLRDLKDDFTQIEDARRQAVTQVQPTERYRQTIRVRDVAFSYPLGARPALAGVDLTIRRGEFIGICGPTGGGKSTLVDLLVGLLEPTQGSILVDGVPLKEQQRWWQEQLGVVSQSSFLIDDTLRANIAFGRATAEVDAAAIERAAGRAQLIDVVASMPEGLDTVVGERGIRLSGGQRQRVAIARALYREPEVVVFDEGTSALDSATEAAVIEALADLRQGRTLISVSHRISTLRHADRILVVNGGRLTHQGSYDDLLSTSPLFRSLAT